MIVHFLIWYLVVPGLAVGGILYTLHRHQSSRGGMAAGYHGENILAGTIRGLIARVRGLFSGLFSDESLQPVATTPTTAPAGPRRQPPPLAAVPDNVAHPAEVAAVGSTGIPGPWRALASYIADFEPDDAGEYVGFHRGNSAGFLAVAEAFRDHAEMMLNQIGLDPAAMHTALDLADLVGDGAQGANLVVRKFLIVYGHILDSETQLPHNAREWLSGEAS